MDNYVKLRVIGKGSYGEVWAVKHKRDKKQYVLKKLDVHNASKRERHAAEQEAKLLSKLKHPNIVAYKDSFETEEGQLYIAMGFCEGGDLYARLKEQKGTALEEKQIVEWFVQIAMALQYMHERNILHRDLKTQNIFLTKSKIIKVGDLGIARVLDHSSDMATTLIGTPYYMSPELFSNKPYNHKSDVWALGCCVYEMTTLKHAFNAKDMNALVYKILRGKMPAMPKQYSDALVALIKAMLNHNPDRRPSVSRILRDPYIKSNIALFLENSKKDKRPVRSAQGERSAEARRSRDAPDGSGDRPRPRKPRSMPVITVEDPEPLQISPDLAPIVEEDMTGTGDSQKSRKSGRRLPSPNQSISSSHDNTEVSDRRAFRPQGNTDPVVVSIDTASLSNSAKDSDAKRDGSPNKNRGSRATRNSVEKLNSSDERQQSHSGERRPNSAGVRRKSREEKSIPTSASSPALSSKDRSPDGRRSAKSVLSNPKPVAKMRPLPAREPVTPRESDKEPKSSRSSRGPGGVNQESGYGSAASYSQDGATSASSNLDTPRTNVSARERRRERKDRETPREPVSARSVELNAPRHSLDPGPRLTRPSSSKSEDYSRNGASRQPKPQYRENHVSKSSDKSSRTDDQKLRRRQPSIDESSENTSEEDDQAEKVTQKENKRNTRPPLSKPSLIVNPPPSGSKLSSPSYQGKDLRPGRDPLKALHPSHNPPTVDQDSDDDDDDEDNRKERDMSNLISVLNTTLQMNKEQDKDEEDDDIFPDDVEPEPPGGTKFIRRMPKLSAVSEEKSGEGDVSVLEVESVQGSPNKFNVNVISPGNAGIKTLTTTGRLWARITDLRKDCIRGLGVEKIKRAYDILDNFDAEELEPQLIQLFGRKDFDLFAGKIWQLKFCEEAAFGLV